MTGQTISQSPSPDDKRPIRVTIVISILLLLASFFLRIHIFGWSRAPLVTEESYERPVPLRRYALTEQELPQNFSRTEVAQSNNDVYSPPGPPPQESRQFTYSGPTGEITLLALRYDTPESAQHVENALVVHGNTILIVKPFPVPPDFAQTIKRVAEQRRSERIRLEKLRIIGHAILCFLIDLLVGSFFFIVALFLAKYFLIIRAVSG